MRMTHSLFVFSCNLSEGKTYCFREMVFRSVDKSEVLIGCLVLFWGIVLQIRTNALCIFGGLVVHPVFDVLAAFSGFDVCGIQLCS